MIGSDDDDDDDDDDISVVYLLHVATEVLTAVLMGSSIFCNIKPCIMLKVNRRFGGIFRLHIVACFHTGCLLGLSGLFYDLKNGGDMFLRNVG
jgi:hypothetical protein